jgi:hypothetical protein
MRTLLAFAIATALCSAARAEDWSQYIDKNPSQPIAVAPAQHTSSPEAKPAPAAARPTKAVATKAKAKPRAATKTTKPRHK